MIPDQGQCALRETIMRTTTNSTLVTEPYSIQYLADLLPLNLSMLDHMVNHAVDRMPSHMVEEP